MWFPLPSTIVAAVTLVTPAHRQLTAERLFADSLFSQMAQAQTTTALPFATCANRKPEMTRLCRGLLQERQSEITRSNSDARLAETTLERSVVELPRSAPAWYGLAMIRVQLSHDTLFSHGGALMDVGTSYLTGAANALSEAIRQDQTFTRAIVALAALPRGREGNDALVERVNLFRKFRSVLPPEVLPGVANLERDAGSVDSAVALEVRALASGKVDAGVVSLGLARDLYRTGVTGEGRRVLLAGAATPTDSTALAYRTQLSWVASPAELAKWDSLAPAARPAWLADFWQKRDIAEGRKDGARLIEHYKRLEYAFKTFAITVPQAGRSHDLTTTTAPDGAATLADFVKRHASCFPSAGRMAELDQSVGAHAPQREYLPVQNQIDDRGVIWIRHGPPNKRIVSTRGEAVEVWRYERSPSPLILQFREVDFSGAVGATTLVPTLITMPADVLDQLCTADKSLCRPTMASAITKSDTSRSNGISSRQSHVSFQLGSDPGADTVRVNACGVTFTGTEARLAVKAMTLPIPATINEVMSARDSGRINIARGTQTDSYVRDFTRAVTPAFQLHALDRGTGGSPRLVVAYALPADQLVPTKGPGGVTYPVSIQLMAADAGGHRTDVDTLHTFQVNSILGKGQYITGVVELPLAPGAYHLSIVVSQDDGRGALARAAQIVVPGDSASLTLSDLVLGEASSGARWNSGTTDVPLNPLGTYKAGGIAEVYFQLGHASVGQQYSTNFEVFRGGDDDRAAPLVAVSSAMVPNQSHMEVVRTLGLQNLAPGRYRIRLTVSGGLETRVSNGWLTIVK